MKQLKDLLYKAGIEELKGNTNINIANVCFNSAAVKSGDLFVAVRGTKTDGHQFISSAITNGAVAIVCEQFPDELNENVNYIKVKDAAVALSYISINYFDNPSSKLKLIGVTGTNGKTTTVTLLYNLFRKLGYRCGLLSTVQNKINDRIVEATHTTPDPIQLNKLLSEMVFEECEYCFMEVSSHAVVQNRITGLVYEGGIFTNITHDHLDYHKTFDAYIKAKKGFFDMLPQSAFALVNADDKNASIMLQNTKARKKTFSLHSMSDFKCKIIENSFSGLLLNIDGSEIATSLIGSFNAYNVTGIYSAAILMGVDKLLALTSISTLHAVDGRFEYITSSNNITGIVDYAHTPDALKNVLNTINDIRSGNEKVITVVGCGGDRDAAKRPVMAKIASELSDKIILTSDNPRSENPDDILKQMQTGVPVHLSNKVLSIADRKEAVKVACTLAKEGDIILVAGKGHEKYQEIKGVKHPFDDKQVLEESFKLLGV